jgi:flagellar basal body-associated protein FliL
LICRGERIAIIIIIIIIIAVAVAVIVKAGLHSIQRESRARSTQAENLGLLISQEQE